MDVHRVNTSPNGNDGRNMYTVSLVMKCPTFTVSTGKALIKIINPNLYYSVSSSGEESGDGSAVLGNDNILLRDCDSLSDS